jgi:hypothetical protein
MNNGIGMDKHILALLRKIYPKGKISLGAR